MRGRSIAACQPSSPAKAGDPVRRSLATVAMPCLLPGAGVTGSPACAGDDSGERGLRKKSRNNPMQRGGQGFTRFCGTTPCKGCKGSRGAGSQEFRGTTPCKGMQVKSCAEPITIRRTAESAAAQ